MQSDLHYNSGIDISSPSHPGPQNAHLAGICSEVEYHSKNEDAQKLNYLENNILLASEQSSASDIDIFIKENKSNKDPDSNVSNKKIKFSIDYILSIPGPSIFFENISLPNFPEHNIADKPLSIEQTPKKRKHSSMSLACKKKAIPGNNQVHEGKNLYRSCQQEYMNAEEECQTRIIYSHASQYKCNVCGEIFTCLSEIEDNYFGHEIHHSTYCRICQKDFDEHRAKGKRYGKFKYCFKDCGFEGTRRIFKQHLYTHSIFRLFKCELFGKRYRTMSSLWQHSRTHPK